VDPLDFASQKIGGNLRAARRTVRLTQFELARRARVQQATISRIECGYANATVGVLLRLAAELKLTLEDLVRGT
jgi:transcriptional regulator with XRE-family HTH domain